MSINFQRALVIGASRGAGREIAVKLAKQGLNTTAVARDEAALNSLTQTDERIKTISQDAALDGVASDLLNEIKPDLLILCVGHAPTMKPFFQQSWEEFSGAWNTDTKAAHAFMSSALQQPMPEGSTIVSFSSGAGLSGSRLSGGYAGAKRMQHFLAEYAQREAEILGLDLRFLTIIPKQLMPDTDIGRTAAEAYSAATGKSFEDFIGQWDAPLTPAKIGDHVLELLAQKSSIENNTFVVTGNGMKKFG